MARRQKTIEQPPVVGTVTSMSHEGRGIIHHEGHPYFVDGALLNETVKIQPVRRRRKITEAKILEVVEPAPDRVEAKCQHASICGGCSLQHMDSSAQVTMKQQSLLDNLQHFGQTAPLELLSPLTAEPWGYRRKARLGVKFVDKKDRLLLGFREKNSHYLADIERCEVLHPKITALYQPLREVISGLSAHRAIPQVEIAVGDDKLALVFRHLEALTAEDHQQLIAFATEQGVDVYLQPGNEDSMHRLHPTDGEELLSYQLLDGQLNLNFRPTDFIQVNGAINNEMIKLVLSLLDLKATDHVLDLFCGVGNISLPLATEAGKVVGVEGDQRLVDRAKVNAERNNLLNTEFYVGDLRESQQGTAWFAEDYDKLVIDPPRTGAIDVIHQLAGKSFERIVYVSCNPATLARDAGELVQQGYVLDKAGVMDMFPHTAHTESIALFRRK